MRATGVPITAFARRSRFDPSPVLRLREHLHRERIAVVHGMHWLSGLTAVLAAATLPHVAVIGSTVGMVYDASQHGHLRHLGDRLAWRRLDRMTVNSEALAEYLLGYGFPQAKLSLVQNGVEIPPVVRAPDERMRARAYLRLLPEEPVVGIIARLTPVKDHRTFLLAAQHIHAQMPEVKFAIVGDGPERTALEEFTDSLGIHDVVRFIGSVPSSNLVLPAFDIAVLCSRHEGMPNALLEAGAWGIPLVASAVGGVPEIVLDGRTGFLTPPGAPDTMAERVTSLLQDPLQRTLMGDRARQLVTEKYSVTTMIRHYELIYRQVAAMRGVRL
jgi:glycosyltransferase involved in cell wall biosynthesis